MKFYAVAKGRQIGIFENWSDCEKQVRIYVINLGYWL